VILNGIHGFNPFTITLQSDYADLDEMMLVSSLEDATVVTVTGSLGYLRSDTPKPTITLTSPADEGTGNVNQNTTFQVTPTWYGSTTASKIEIWTNNTGSWANTTEILSFSNATLTDIIYNFTTTQKILWNAKLYTNQSNVFAGANRTLTITLPSPVNGVSGYNQTRFNKPTLFYSSWTPADGYTLDEGQFEWDLGSGYVWVETVDASGGWANFTYTIPSNMVSTPLRYRITVNHTTAGETILSNNFLVTAPVDILPELTWFTEVDGNNRTVITTEDLIWTGVTRNETIYNYLDLINVGDFSYDFKVNVTHVEAGDSSAQDFFGVISLSDTIGDLQTLKANDAVYFQLSQWAYYDYKKVADIYAYDDGGLVDSDTFAQSDTDVVIYCKFSRVGGTVTLAIYTDPAMSILDDTLTLSGFSPSLRYLQVGFSINEDSDPDDWSSGVLSRINQTMPSNNLIGYNQTYPLYPTQIYSNWTANGEIALDKGVLEWDLNSGYVWVETVDVSGGWANFTQILPLSMSDDIIYYRITVNNTAGESTLETGDYIPVSDPSPSLDQIGYTSLNVNATTLLYSEWTNSSGSTLDSGVLFYRVDYGSWVNESVTLSGKWANKTLFLIPAWSGLDIEYYFTVNNTYGNSTNSYTDDFTVTNWNPVTSEISHSQEHGGLSNTFTAFLNTSLSSYPELETVFFQYSVSGTSWVNTSVAVTGTPMWANVTLDNPLLQYHELTYRWYYKNDIDVWTASANNTFTICLNDADPNGFYWEYVEINASTYVNNAPEPQYDYYNYFVRVYKTNVTHGDGSYFSDEKIYTHGHNQTDMIDVGFWYLNATTRMDYAVQVFDSDAEFTRFAVKLPVSEFDENNRIKFWIRWGGTSGDWESHDSLAYRQSVFPLYDDFEDGSIDSSLWTVTGNVTESNGKLVIGEGGAIVSKEEFWLEEFIGIGHDYVCRFLAEDWGFNFEAFQSASYRSGYALINDPLPPNQASGYSYIGGGDVMTMGFGMIGTYQTTPLSFRLSYTTSAINWHKAYEPEMTTWDWSGGGAMLERPEENSALKMFNTKPNTAWVEYAMMSRWIYFHEITTLPLDAGFGYPTESGNTAPTSEKMFFSDLNDGIFILTGLDAVYPIHFWADDEDGSSDLFSHEFALSLQDGDFWINGSYVPLTQRTGTLSLSAGEDYVDVVSHGHTNLFDSQAVSVELRFLVATPAQVQIDGWHRISDGFVWSAWDEYPDLAETMTYDDGGGSGSGGGFIISDDGDGDDGDGFGGGRDPDFPDIFDPDAYLPDAPLIEIYPDGGVIRLFNLPWVWSQAQKTTVIAILGILILMILGAISEKTRRSGILSKRGLIYVR